LVAAALVAPAATAQTPKGLGELLASVVTVHARALASARDPAGIGVERWGTGIVIEPGGLIVTSATVVQEVASVLVTTGDGRTVRAVVAAQDPGIDAAVLRPAAALAVPGLSIGSARRLDPQSALGVLGAARGRIAGVTFLVGRGDYAAPWEQLVDNALFASPAVADGAGAALVDGAGHLVGVGTHGRMKVVQDRAANPSSATGNVFIPVEAFRSLLDHAARADGSELPRRPWLGIVIEVEGPDLVVSRVMRGSPAERADLRASDVILAVDGEAVESRAALYRQVWQRGRPGAEIRLAIRRAGLAREVRVRTMDAHDYFIQRAAAPGTPSAGVKLPSFH
jgi:S1-C subfamily serine protease